MKKNIFVDISLNEFENLNINSMSTNEYYTFYDETKIGGNKKVKIKMILNKTLSGKLDLLVEESSITTRWVNPDYMGIYFNSRKDQLYRLQKDTFHVMVQTELYHDDYFLLGYNFFLPALKIKEILKMSSDIKHTIESSVKGY